jgi:hypothetical protein
MDALSLCTEVLTHALSRISKGSSGEVAIKRSSPAATHKYKRTKPEERLEDKLRDFLSDNKYLFLSESRKKLGLPPLSVENLAERIGAVLIDTGGDIAVLMPEVLVEYDEILASTKTPDPEDASNRLGVYGRLFERMLKAGLVYYDAGKRCWKRL